MLASVCIRVCISLKVTAFALGVLKRIVLGCVGVGDYTLKLGWDKRKFNGTFFSFSFTAITLPFVNVLLCRILSSFRMQHF